MPEASDQDEWRPMENGNCFSRKPMAEAALSSSNSLSNVQKVSAEKKHYSCDQCKKSFTVKRELVTHRRIHQGRPTFRCFRCSKEFGTQQLLRKHEVWHTGERSHICPQCGKAFYQKGHLTQHTMIHSGGRPHGCPVCSKTFIFKFDLNRHMKTHDQASSKAADKDCSSGQKEDDCRPCAPSSANGDEPEARAKGPSIAGRVLDDTMAIMTLQNLALPPPPLFCIFCAHYQHMTEVLKKHIEKLERVLLDREAHAEKLNVKLLGAHSLLDSIVDHCTTFDQLWSSHTQTIVSKLHELLILLK